MAATNRNEALLHTLLKAIHDGNANEVRKLIDQGAPLNQVATYGPHKGFSPVLMSVALISQEGHTHEILNMLLDAGANIIESEGAPTVLWFVTVEKKWDTLRLLNEKRHEQLKVNVNNIDWNPLERFMSFSLRLEYDKMTTDQLTSLCTEYFSILKSLGADFLQPTKYQQKTPMDVFSQRVRDNYKHYIVDKLYFLIGVPLETNLPYAEYLLNKAILYNDIEGVEALVQKGLSLNATERPNTIPPLLCLAADSSDLPMVEYLIEKGVPVDERHQLPGHLADRPIHYAIEKRKADIVRVLLHHGASVADVPDERPPLELAATSTPEILTLILEAGANPNLQKYTVPPENLEAALMFVSVGQQVFYYDTPLIKAIGSRNLENIRILLQHGADPNIPVPYGNALVYSVAHLAWNEMRTLLDFPGIDVTVELKGDYEGLNVLDLIEQRILPALGRPFPNENWRRLRNMETEKIRNKAGRKIKNFITRKTAKAAMSARAARPPGTLGPNNTGGEVFKLGQRSFQSKTSGTRRRRRR